MKNKFFNLIKDVFEDKSYSTIGEIGTHKAGSAKQFVWLLSPRTQKLHYTGYDVFDSNNDPEALRKKERNGKSTPTIDQAIFELDRLKNRFLNFDYTLHQGLTSDTLTTPKKFDFVYIDGGHSYETVKHDYSMVKESSLIIFDDANLPGVKKFLNELSITTEIHYIIDKKRIWGIIRNEV